MTHKYKSNAMTKDKLDPFICPRFPIRVAAFDDHSLSFIFLSLGFAMANLSIRVLFLF